MVSATAAFGQGSILMANYVSPYNAALQIKAPGGAALAANSPVQFQLYYGEGTLAEGALTAGIILGMDPTKTFDGGAGPGGWLLQNVQPLSTWAAGDTFTFQLRTLPGTIGGQAIDTVLSRSLLWTETAAIQPSANPPAPMTGFQGFTIVVPEPSTFALAGLGAAALLIFRRRN
jgi:hypothetical protein